MSPVARTPAELERWASRFVRINGGQLNAIDAPRFRRDDTPFDVYCAKIMWTQNGTAMEYLVPVAPGLKLVKTFDLPGGC